MGEAGIVATNSDLPSEIMRLPWVQHRIQDGFAPVLTTGALLSRSSELPVDHMFTTFLRFGLLRNLVCLYKQSTQQYCSIISLGSDVCGHPTVVHGGLTAAIIDETFGGIVYILKREGVIESGPSYTVHLEVDYKSPVPASNIICCTTELIENAGRKTWVKATVESEPGGTLYAVGKALFVVPRPESVAASLGWKGMKPVESEAAGARGGAETNGHALQQ